MTRRLNRRSFIAGTAAGTMMAYTGNKMTEANAPQEDAEWPSNARHNKVLAEAQKSVDDAIPLVARDRFIPAFHFSPPARFMNDPNGCIQVNGIYHVFYQHLPYFGVEGARMVPGWGHATSRDLIHWEHQPIALMPIPSTYDGEGIASGYCVVADGKPTIIYTSIPPQAQSLARSFDNMRTWRRYRHNPVLPSPPDIPDLGDGFRDPFVWKENAEWRMLVGSGYKDRGGVVLLYRSSDLTKWSFVGPLCHGMGSDCFQWECPNFFKLGDSWVLIVSPLLHSRPDLRGPVQYAVGDYDGVHFEHGDWHLLDVGGPSVFYAPNSLADNHGRRILFGWLMGGGEADSPWNGLLTLPRQLQIGKDGELRVWPVREVEKLRAENLCAIGTRHLAEGETLELGRGNQLDVEIVLDGTADGALEIHLLASESREQATVIRYNARTGLLLCGDHSGTAKSDDSKSRTLRILIDRSVVEAYANRLGTMSLRAFPPIGDDCLRLKAVEGDAAIRSIKVWRMRGIWEASDADNR